MAFKYINEILHEIKKVYKGKCDKCGKGVCVGWLIRHPAMTQTEPTTTYCYDCTANQWMKALSIHCKMTHNALHEGPSGASREGPLDAVVGRQRTKRRNTNG